MCSFTPSFMYTHSCILIDNYSIIYSFMYTHSCSHSCILIYVYSFIISFTYTYLRILIHNYSIIYSFIYSYHVLSFLVICDNIVYHLTTLCVHDILPFMFQFVFIFLFHNHFHVSWTHLYIFHILHFPYFMPITYGTSYSCEV